MKNPDENKVPTILSDKQEDQSRKLAIDFLKMINNNFNALRKKEFYNELCQYVGWDCIGVTEHQSGLEIAGLEGLEEDLAFNWINTTRQEIKKMGNGDPSAAIEAIRIRLEEAKRIFTRPKK